MELRRSALAAMERSLLSIERMVMRERAVCKTARDRTLLQYSAIRSLVIKLLHIRVLQSILCLITLFWKFDCGTTVPHFSNSDTLRKEVVLFLQEHM